MKPVVGTDSCQVLIESGHDAWVVGDEGFVGLEFDSRAAEEYAVVTGLPPADFAGRGGRAVRRWCAIEGP